MLEKLNHPLSLSLFKAALDVWANAEKGRAPNDTSSKAPTLATVNFLEQHGVDAEELAAYMNRLLNMPQIYKEREGRLSPYFTENASGRGHITDALAAAILNTEFVCSPKRIGFDLDDIAIKAAAYATSALASFASTEMH